MFTFPLLIRAVGVVPLIVIRNGGDTVALLGRWWARWRWRSSATAVVAWLAAIVISGLTGAGGAELGRGDPVPAGTQLATSSPQRRQGRTASTPT
jgi:uncharacterized membrane protein YdfJ with MMPL/SSD domain